MYQIEKPIRILPCHAAHAMPLLYVCYCFRHHGLLRPLALILNYGLKTSLLFAILDMLVRFEIDRIFLFHTRSYCSSLRLPIAVRQVK